MNAVNTILSLSVAALVFLSDTPFFKKKTGFAEKQSGLLISKRSHFKARLYVLSLQSCSVSAEVSVICEPQMKFWEQTLHNFFFIFFGLKNVKCKMNFSPNSLMEMEMGKKTHQSLKKLIMFKLYCTPILSAIIFLCDGGTGIKY